MGGALFQQVDVKVRHESLLVRLHIYGHTRTAKRRARAPLTGPTCSLLQLTLANDMFLSQRSHGKVLLSEASESIKQ
jgi:hypothetical protein